MHVEAYEWLSSINVPMNYRILEVGSRNINGSARSIFAPWAELYVGVDVVAGPGVDMVGDLFEVQNRLKLTAMYGNQWDMIVCTETLEHTPPIELLTGIFNLAHVGTRIIMTWASSERAPHGATGGALESGEYYRGVPADEFVAIVSTLAEVFGYTIEIEIQKHAGRGDVYAEVKVVGRAY
jgi:hypothetical protein